MTRPPPLLERPWHVFVSPFVPALALLSNAIDVMPPRVAFVTMLVSLAGALAAWLLFYVIFRSAPATAIVVTTLILVMLSGSTIVRFAANSSLPGGAALVYLALFAVCPFVLWRGGRAAEATRFANVLVLPLAVVFCVRVAAYEIGRPARQLEVRSPEPVNPSADARPPDIYVLILDGYGREDVLRDMYGIDAELPRSLEALGFEVASRARSNYTQTALSVASALNGDYLQSLLEGVGDGQRDRRLLADLIARNRIFASLEAAGYRIRTYSSEYPLIRPLGVHERRGPLLPLTEFEFIAYAESAAPSVSAWFGDQGRAMAAWHRYQVQWTLDDLARTPVDSTGPALVFVHLLAPHPPFVFEADGSLRPTPLPITLRDGPDWREVAQGTPERYEQAYAGNVRFINRQIPAVVKAILDRSVRPTMIYIQGDHGPGSHLSRDSAAQTDLRERFGILMAMRFADSHHPALPSETTPVNGFRLLVNAAIGAGLPYLEDRSYFSPWFRPFEFEDVTGKVAASTGDDR